VTKNEVITNLYNSKNFNDCIGKMEPDYLREDLKSEVLSVVCEWPDEKVIGLYERKELDFYVVRVILNQVKSKTSPFAKKYRRHTEELNGHEVLDFHDLDERALKEELEDIAIEEIDNLYWYDGALIKLYVELGNFRAIETVTQIPFISCYKNIKKSLQTLKTVSIKKVK
jgi:hypothetical protein